jgi:hypothetical protein
MPGIKDVVLCKIHPAIGVARVGNSPTSYFVGPEIPGVFSPPAGGYKDEGDAEHLIAPRIKRQAARFRVFGYAADGTCIGEITSMLAGGKAGQLTASVVWTVHLVNKKAAFNKFRGPAGENDEHPPAPLRNKDIIGADRQKLVIDPGSRDVSGPNARAEFSDGTFLGIRVPLGEVRTDDSGHLLVLGGFGKSGTAAPSSRITNYANNDRWYDDISDGPVSATVRDSDGRNIPVVGSWVLVTPPDFAPALSHVTTLYDVAVEVAVAKGLMAVPEKPSFTRHIYPILSRACALQWVNRLALAGHGPDSGSGTRIGLDLMKHIKEYADNSDATKPARQAVFGHLRNPIAPIDEQTARDQANRKFMPPLSGDTGDAQVWQDDYAPDEPFKPGTWLTLTRLQYSIMQKWAEGNFEADWQTDAILKASSSADSLILGEKPLVANPDSAADPDGLDRAALEACVGGAFYPGIEAGWVMRNGNNYMEKERFRLDHDRLSAGDVSQHMACPWQADFYECNTDWWPAQRPDDVLTDEHLLAVAGVDNEIANLDKDDPNYSDTLKYLNTRKTTLWLTRESWTRGFPDNDSLNDAYSHAGDETMVDDWHHLGFIVNQRKDGSEPALDGKIQYIETERYKYVTGMAESFHCLLNMEQYPGFVTRAKELAEQFLADAKFDADPNYAEFSYTKQAFDDRMTKIYNDFVDQTMNFPLWTETGNITWSAVVDYDSDGEPIKATRHYNVGPFSNKAVKERIFQASPFNLIDGAWLQSIMRTGPADEVRARLFSIWSDEAGNGLTELNHCNVYDTLLRSQNIYVPVVSSKEFIEQDFIKSAFDGSVIQLAVGMFPEDYLPELLGMTLYLEWEATPTLTPIVKAYQARNIDPHFYRMHVAIDNISAGHGALVKEAIEIYLQAREKDGGDPAVQEHWKRIWRGYVAWATAGFAGNELLERMMLVDRKTIYIQSSLLRERDILRPMIPSLKTPADPVSLFLRKKLQPHTRELVDGFSEPDPDPDPGRVLESVRSPLRGDLNNILRSPDFWDSARFKSVALSAETLALINHNPHPTGVDLIDLNRWLLEDAYPIGIARKNAFPDVRAYHRGKMRDLIVRKAPVAKNGVHDSVLLKDLVNNVTKPLRELFDDPDQLLDMLANSSLIDIRHPRQSALFDRFDFSGPMYKVFTPEDQNVILDWIESLGKPGVATAPPQPAPSYPDDPAAAVLQILTEKVDLGKKVSEHGQYSIKAGTVSKSVLAWMNDGSRSLMDALRQDASWIVPGQAQTSNFYKLIVSGPMQGVFDTTQQDFFAKWINAGAPMPAGSAENEIKRRSAFQSLTVDTAVVNELRENIDSRDERALKFHSYERPEHFADRRRHIGMGSVH